MKRYHLTLAACYLGYVVQAIETNYISLLVLQFNREFGISVDMAAMLISLNFCVQLLVDILSMPLVGKMGYRKAALAANFSVAAGLCLFTVLPGFFRDALSAPVWGMALCVVLIALGGGLIEVLLTPIAEGCPFPHKASVLNMLHSFYCWGYVIFVLLSIRFNASFGVSNWRVLTVFWLLFPIADILLFLRCPLPPLSSGEAPDAGTGASDRERREESGGAILALLLLIMLCAGAAEHGVSQWSSTIAEKELGLSKTMGDVAGPLAFAVLMGLGRTGYALAGRRYRLIPSMTVAAAGCCAAYLMIAFLPWELVPLGFGAAGLFVSILWPCACALAADTVPQKNVAMFAKLAVAGDAGCISGPFFVALLGERLRSGLRGGILCAAIIPLACLLAILAVRRTVERR